MTDDASAEPMPPPASSSRGILDMSGVRLSPDFDLSPLVQVGGDPTWMLGGGRVVHVIVPVQPYTSMWNLTARMHFGVPRPEPAASEPPAGSGN